ncbi:molecular chaperone [Acinetobacter baumannii]|uniref:fimbrial biogenesis chaperone n=1 Tax=Acinetobacter calcoaceticus/baumannii complex TaxID=909768 RepID=UPI0024B63CD1|nr:molecular chaperone [Acinetobacter baumannii]MDI9705333.1 molecular chaperone [Acinetobacter baumannii]MDI9807660.1 molecular chaperone [Acinetobacter baumannii]
MRLNHFIFTVCLALIPITSHSAIQALASRVIFNADAKAATLAIRNNADKAYMVQNWLEVGDTPTSDSKVPFVITPPLLKLDSKKETLLRIVYSGSGLPTDRESQFWINIQEIPPKPEVENTLQLAVRSKIKLFYRPKQVDIELSDAIKKVRWYVEGNTLKLENKSPLFITIGDLKLNNSDLPVANMNQDMVAPFKSIDVIKNLPKNINSINYTYINEYGGNTTVPTVSLK